MTRPPSFPLQPKLTWIEVLFSNYLTFWYLFTIWLPFENISHYLNIDNPHWLREDVQWFLDKVIRKKFMCLLASTFSSRTFRLIFLVFACIFWYFHDQKPSRSLSSIRCLKYGIYWLPLIAIVINGVDNRSFWKKKFENSY